MRGYDIAAARAPVTTSIGPPLAPETEYPIWSNEAGCFDRPIDSAAPVLLIGDSFTHLGTRLEDKWGTRLGQQIRSRVLMCGVAGYGTRQEMLKAAELIERFQLHPRLIVLGYYLNDLENDWLFPYATVIDGFHVSDRSLDRETGVITRTDPRRGYESFVRYGTPEPPPAWYLRVDKRAYQSSIVYHLARDGARWAVLTALRHAPSAETTASFYELAFLDRPWIEAAWARHFDNLRELQGLARAKGAKLFVVIIPTKVQVYDSLIDWGGVDRERANRRLHAFFAAAGIPFVDLLPVFRAHADLRPRKTLDSTHDLFWNSDAHFSPLGERLAADTVARALQDRHLVSFR